MKNKKMKVDPKDHKNESKFVKRVKIVLAGVTTLGAVTATVAKLGMKIVKK